MRPHGLETVQTTDSGVYNNVIGYCVPLVRTGSRLLAKMGRYTWTIERINPKDTKLKGSRTMSEKPCTHQKAHLPQQKACPVANHPYSGQHEDRSEHFSPAERYRAGTTRAEAIKIQRISII